MELVRSHILCCTGTGCSSSNSLAIIEEFERCLKANGLENEAKIVKTGCHGLCAKGPIVVVYPEGAFYTHVTVEDVEEIVTEHILKGRIVKRLLFNDQPDEAAAQALNETDFFKKQYRIVLRNCAGKQLVRRAGIFHYHRGAAHGSGGQLQRPAGRR